MDEHTRELVRSARMGDAEDYMNLIDVLLADEEALLAAVRAKRRDIDLVIGIALNERPEVNRRQLAKKVGIAERSIYKRRDRGYPDELRGELASA